MGLNFSTPQKKSLHLLKNAYYAPNFKEVEGAYWFGSVCPVVCSESVMREKRLALGQELLELGS